MKPSLVTRRALVAAGVSLFGPAIARAQSGLPDKPLRILVGFPAGGGSDLIARAVAPVLEHRLGRRVSVENRPGNTGAMAGEALRMAPPDGTTIALLPSTTLSSKLLVPAYPFDPLKDLAPITLAGSFQTAIAVSPKIEVTTLADYVRWLKQGDPRRNRLGLPADDAFLQIYSRMVGRAFDVTLEGVPFRGSAPMVSDLADGRIPAAYGGVIAFIEYHRAKRLKMLVTSGPERVAAAKDVPAAAELGYPALLMAEWYGFFARTGTAAPLITAWNKELSIVLALPAVSGELSQLGLEVASSTPQECAERLERHLQRWREVLESFNIKPFN